MIKYIKVLAAIFFILNLSSLGFCQQETFTITTYYPSPYGSYRELRAQRMAIGDNYYGPDYCWPPETCTYTIDPRADLVVEGSLLVGTIQGPLTPQVPSTIGLVVQGAISHDPNNNFYGQNPSTHVNLGIASTTGRVGAVMGFDRWCTVGGGYGNNATYVADTVSGGNTNTASGGYSTVSGGANNAASGSGTVVAGGYGNKALGYGSAVLGGASNEALLTGDYSIASGGYDNTASGQYSTVSGGNTNTASGQYSTVSGGLSNEASVDYATVSGGASNEASVDYATVSGGYTNIASSWFSTVSGGQFNIASYDYATVSGGNSNQATLYGATVPGGVNNAASGNFSFAAGYRAKALHQGCFVWADSTDADFSSGAANRFYARAAGGVWFYSNSTLTSGVYLAAGANAWTSISDKNLKENFRSVDGEGILLSIRKLPLSTWNYKSQDKSIRHLGPVAQDFYAAFHLGESNTGISTVDIDGVNMAAIQALEKRTAELKAKIEELEKLKAEFAELKTKVK